MSTAETGPATGQELDEQLDEGWAQVDSSPEDVISESDTRSDGSSGVSPSRGAQPPAMEPSLPAGGESKSARPPEDTATEVEEEETQQEEPEMQAGGAEGETAVLPADDHLAARLSPTAPAHELLQADTPEPVDSAVDKAPPDEDSGRSQEISMSSPISIAVDVGSPAPAPMPLPPGVESIDSMGSMSREDVEPTDEPIVESPRAVNWGWGFGALSGALKDVSAGVARDVRELKESFQAAIQVDSDEEEGYEDEVPSQEMHAEPAEPVPQMTEEELQRQAVLSKLGQLKREDTDLTKGFKKLDDQVEQLATGLWGFMGQAGQGMGSLARKVEAATKGVAAEVASEFKETLEDVKGLHMAQVATSGIAAATTTGKRLVATAEKGLVNVVNILDAGLSADDFNDVGEELNFDECFYAARGQAALEETEELGNECSRLCNRSRRTLPEAKRRELDELLSNFAPLFDLEAKLVKPSEVGKGAVPKSESYAKIEGLRSKAVDIAFELSSAATQLASKQPAIVSSAGGEGEGQPSGEGQRSIPQAAEEGLAVLANIRSEGTRSLAILGSAGVSHLLQLGNSMGAPLFGTKPDYVWPEAANDKATLLRFAAQQIEEDARAVAAAFGRSLAEADEALMTCVRAAEAAAEGREVPTQSEKPVHALLLAKDLDLAIQAIRQAFRALMYVVLATTIPASSSGSSRTGGQDEAAAAKAQPQAGEEDDDEDLDWADDAADLEEDEEDEDES